MSESKTRACPRCSSPRVHRSRRKGVAEHVVALAGFRTRRCHECNFRFARIGESFLTVRDVDRVIRKMSFGLLAVLALALVLGAVLWFSGKSAEPSHSETCRTHLSELPSS